MSIAYRLIIHFWVTIHSKKSIPETHRSLKNSIESVGPLLIPPGWNADYLRNWVMSPSWFCRRYYRMFPRSNLLENMKKIRI